MEEKSVDENYHRYRRHIYKKYGVGNTDRNESSNGRYKVVHKTRDGPNVWLVSHVAEDPETHF